MELHTLHVEGAGLVDTGPATDAGLLSVATSGAHFFPMAMVGSTAPAQHR